MPSHVVDAELLSGALEIAVALVAPGREIDVPVIVRLTQFLYSGLREHAEQGLPIDLESARHFGAVLLGQFHERRRREEDEAGRKSA